MHLNQSRFRFATAIEPDAPRCPVCDAISTEVRGRLPYCEDCRASWEECVTPAQYAEGRGLTPHRARQRLIGRRPWHHNGRPIVPEARRAEA